MLPPLAVVKPDDAQETRREAGASTQAKRRDSGLLSRLADIVTATQPEMRYFRLAEQVNLDNEPGEEEAGMWFDCGPDM